MSAIVKCKSCPAQIEWIVMKATGAKSPLIHGAERIAVFEGASSPGIPRITVITDDGRAVTGIRRDAVSHGLPGFRIEFGRISHFVDCPGAKKHRKGKAGPAQAGETRRPEPAEPDALDLGLGTNDARAHPEPDEPTANSPEDLGFGGGGR